MPHTETRPVTVRDSEESRNVSDKRCGKQPVGGRAVHSLIPQSVLRQVHSFFRSEFSTECDLVLPLSIYSILSFLNLLKPSGNLDKTRFKIKKF
jgi:hypothetical protein